MGGISCELNMGIKRIKVVEELLGVFLLVDDKGVIHIPEWDPGRVGGSADGSGFKVLHEQVIYQWAYGGPSSSTMYLFIILTLECEKGILRQNSSRITILQINKEVLLVICGSCCSLPQMMSRTGSTGTDVKRAFTS